MNKNDIVQILMSIIGGIVGVYYIIGAIVFTNEENIKKMLDHRRDKD